MSEDRLDGLALMQYCHDIQLSPDEIAAESQELSYRSSFLSYTILKYVVFVYV